MQPLQVKVCGLNDPANLQQILSLTVNFVGLIFYPKSPRFIGKKGLDPAILLKGSARRVGVFVNAPIPDLLEKVGRYELDLVQLHGEEDPEYCRELKQIWPTLEIIKAFGIDAGFDFTACDPYAGFCRYFLFDTKYEEHGGSGRRFAWEELQAYEGETPFFLSGGIDEEHVQEIRALRHPQLFGVDINSRFEISPGRKDVEKVRRFISAL